MLLIIDGGPCEVGIESTVIVVSGDTPLLLRPGSITLSQLRSVVGDVEAGEISQQGAAPGTSLQHYAPRTPAERVESSRLASRLAQVEGVCVVLCFDASAVKPPHIAIVMPRDPASYAKKLYEALREADGMNAKRILIESPPGFANEDDDAWRAVRDRLRRATA